VSQEFEVEEVLVDSTESSLTALTVGASLANFVVKTPGHESLLSNHPTACLSILVKAITRSRIINFSEANVNSHV